MRTSYEKTSSWVELRLTSRDGQSTMDMLVLLPNASSRCYCKCPYRFPFTTLESSMSSRLFLNTSPNATDSGESTFISWATMKLSSEVASENKSRYSPIGRLNTMSMLPWEVNLLSMTFWTI